jgi:hypothetical protein
VGKGDIIGYEGYRAVSTRPSGEGRLKRRKGLRKRRQGDEKWSKGKTLGNFLLNSIRIYYLNINHDTAEFSKTLTFLC